MNLIGPDGAELRRIGLLLADQFNQAVLAESVGEGDEVTHAGFGIDLVAPGDETGEPIDVSPGFQLCPD